MTTPLPDGLVLRTARPADLEQIGALLVERGEPADALDHRLVVDDPDAGWESCAVVVDGDRVVSTATLLDETVRVGHVVMPAGQVELVATDEAYEGRGLVRALMGWAHDRSEARGHLLQIMIGIPYFYRIFGYEYAVDIPRARAVTAPAGGGSLTDPESLVVDPPAGFGSGSGSESGSVAVADVDASTTPASAVPQTRGALRPATVADLPAVTALQDRVQAGFDVAMPHPAARRRWLLAHEGSDTWVLERDGAVVATARTSPPDDGLLVAEAAALDDDAAVALLAALADQFPGVEMRVVDRVGTVTSRVWADRLGTSGTEAEQYYARIARPEVVLDALRPVLHRRIAEAGLDRVGQDVVVSTFGAHYRLAVSEEGLGPVRRGGPMQSPGVHRGAGVAPDALPALLLGPYGIRGLTERRSDVYPGPDRELFEALFPPLTADLLTYYLPW